MKPPRLLGSYFLTAPVNALRGAVVTQRNRRAAARLDAKPKEPLRHRVRSLGEGDAGIEKLLRALDVGLAEDAGEIVDALARQLKATLATQTGSQRAATLPAICEALVRSGQHDAALAHARAHRRDLLSTVRGVNVLTSLDDPSVIPTEIRLPNGRFNMALLQRQLDHHALDAVGLERLVAKHPLATFEQPELCLLSHQAEQTRRPQLADAALAAYFASEGVRGPHRDAQGIAGYGLPSRRSRPRADAPLISVLVAAFNAQHTVVPAIESLLAQDHGRVEVLICDDGSTDDTVPLLRSRYANEPAVRLYSSSVNQGPYNIRNALLAEATGQIIAYHDADDLALPTRLGSQLAALRATSADACFTSWVRVRPSGIIQVFRDQGVRRLSLISLMAHRRVIDSLGGFRSARFAADREFHLRLVDAPSIRIARVRAPQLLGLWSPQSLTQARGSESLANGFRSLPRRAYAAAVFQQRVLGQERVSDADIDAVLREHAAYIPPAGIHRIS